MGLSSRPAETQRMPPGRTFSNFGSSFLAASRIGKAIALAAIALACGAGLLADTPSRIRRIDVGGCYCQCAEGHTRAGCAKMCELPKYSKRWWATTCVKLHYQRPAPDSHAGPR